MAPVVLHLLECKWLWECRLVGSSGCFGRAGHGLKKMVDLASRLTSHSLADLRKIHLGTHLPVNIVVVGVGNVVADRCSDAAGKSNMTVGRNSEVEDSCINVGHREVMDIVVGKSLHGSRH